MPLVFLFWETSRQATVESQEESSSLLERSTPLARMFRELSAPDSLIRSRARRLKIAWENADRASLPLDSRQACLGRVLQSFSAGPASEAFLWAVVFPDGNPKHDPIVLSGNGTAVSEKRLVSSLLRDVVRQNLRKGKNLEDLGWANLLRGLFGYRFFPSLFAPAYMGTPLPTVYRRKSGFLTFEICKNGDKVLGAFLLLMTENPDRLHFVGVNYLMNNWRPGGVIPAVLPLPIDMGPATGEIRLPAKFDRPKVRAVLDRFARSFGVRKSRNFGDQLGDVRLPVHLVNRVITLGPWWARVCPLDVRTGKVGVLLFPKRPRLPTSLGLLLQGGVVIWSVTMILIFGNRMKTGNWPEPGVRQSLRLWFVGLVSLPILAGLVAGNRFLDHHERNLRRALAHSLENRLRAIEQDVGRKLAAPKLHLYKLLSSSYQGGRPFLTLLEEAFSRKDQRPKVLDEMLEKSRIAGIELLSVFVFAPGTMTFQAGSLDIASKDNPQVQPLLRRLWGGILKPYASEPASVTGNIPGSGLFGADFSNLLTLKSAYLDRADKFWIGETQLMCLATPVYSGKIPKFVVSFFWDQEARARDFLIARLPQESLSSDDLIGIGFFQRTGSALHLKVASGCTIDFPNLARDAVPSAASPRVLGDGARLGISIATSDFPRLLLIAQASLSPVKAKIASERMQLQILFAAALAMVFLLGNIMSHWMASPIIRISSGLDKIAKGDLAITVSEARPDELGEAGRILDSMTRELAERKKLARFVAPQVLAAVAGGNLRQAAEGERMTATVLTSDIRSFTTLSETNSPRDVFQALNTHFQAMTVAIQSHGGVVGQFIGDAVVAGFSPSIKSVTGGRAHAGRALAAAREMRSAHNIIQSRRRAAGLFGYEIGIGLETGEVLSGIVGDGEVRLDYSVLGEPVIRSAELESLSRHGHASRIIASTIVRKANPAVRFDQLPDFDDAWETLESRTENRPLSGPASPTAEHPENQGEAWRKKCDEQEMPNHLKKFGSCESPKFQKTTEATEATEATEVTKVTGGENSGFLRNHEQKVPQIIENPRSQRAFKHLGGGVLSIVAIIWLLPLFIWIGGIDAWLQTLRDAELATTFSALDEDRRFLQRKASPELAWMESLQKMFPVAPFSNGSALDAASATNAIAARTIESCRKLEKRFPGLFWAYLSAPTFNNTVTASFSEVELEFASESAKHLWKSDPVAPWELIDLGNAMPEGKFQPDGAKNWNLTGGGFETETRWDSCFYRFQSGPIVSLTAKIGILSRERHDTNSGLMIRGGLEGNSPSAYLCVRQRRLSLVVRKEQGTDARVIASLTLPLDLDRIWLQLTRLPNEHTFKASFSTDSLEWKELRIFSFPVDSDAFWGCSVCAGNRSNLDKFWDTNNLTHGGPLPDGLTSETARILLFSLGYDFVGNLSDKMKTKDRFNPEKVPETKKFLEFVCDPMNVFAEGMRMPIVINLSGKDRTVFWTPFLLSDSLFQDRDWADRSGGAGRRSYDPERRNEREEVQRETRGFLLLIFPKGIKPGPLPTPDLLRELRRRGAEGAVSNRNVASFSAATQGFHTKITGTSPAMDSTTDPASDNWRYLNFQEPGDDGRNLVIARRLTDWNKKTWVRLLTWFLPGCWFVGGLTFLLRWKIVGIGSVPLRRQLLSGFLLALVPSLFLAIVTLERSRVEGEIRQKEESRRFLQAAIDSVDDASAITMAWMSGLVLHAGSGSDNFNLKKMFENLTSRGLVLRDVNLVGADGTGRRVAPDNPVERESAFAAIFSQFAREMSRMRGLPEPARLKGSEGSDMLVGSQIDEFIQTLTFGIGPRIPAALLLSPFHFQNWAAGQSFRHFSLHAYLHPHGKPLQSLMVNWTSGEFERHLFSPFNTNASPWNPVRIRPIQARRPSLRLAPEFVSLLKNFLFYFRLATPFDHRLVETALKTGIPAVERHGKGRGEHLVAIQMAKELGGIFIRGDLPLGRIIEDARGIYLLQEVTLMLLLILALILSLVISRRFLSPVRLLMDAAKRVAEGDFSARLEVIDRTEFGVLAGAFNNMAREAQEGKLLGRFVSDAVRETLRDGGMEAAAREGNAGRAVVLFAGIGGFKELLRTEEPVRLIAMLNNALATMSRAVRAEGGDVDKFIGEKMLAFFPVSDDGNPALAAQRALRATLSLLEKLPSTLEGLSLRPAAGLTFGPVLFGMMGAAEVRLDMTILGDTVNLASRLADLAAKEPGGGTIVDGNFAALLGEQVTDQSRTSTARIDDVNLAAPPGEPHAYAGSRHAPANPPPVSGCRLNRLPITTVKGKTREVTIFKVVTG